MYERRFFLSYFMFRKSCLHIFSNESKMHAAFHDRFHLLMLYGMMNFIGLLNRILWSWLLLYVLLMCVYLCDTRWKIIPTACVWTKIFIYFCVFDVKTLKITGQQLLSWPLHLYIILHYCKFIGRPTAHTDYSQFTSIRPVLHLITSFWANITVDASFD